MKLRHHEALECYDRSIQLNPHDSDAYLNKGEILIELSRYEEALQILKAAINISPNNSEAYYKKGNCYLKLKKYERYNIKELWRI